MSWIKKDLEVEVTAEMESDFSKISKTDAYEVEIVDVHLQNGKDSDSVSVVVGVKTEDGDTNSTYFTVMGRDGNTYYMGSVAGKAVKKQHFGLSSINTLFDIVLGKEIFDIEPSEVEYKQWDNESKAMVDVKGDGFPDLIGKKVGVTVQMTREIDGADSKEYGTITHFFNHETGLFSGEEESDRTKLSKWLRTMKEFIVKESTTKSSSSFGKKADSTDDSEPKRKKWGVK